jgi:hypothetical protein
MRNVTRWCKVWYRVVCWALGRGWPLARAAWDVLVASLLARTREALAWFEANPGAFPVGEQVKLRSIVVSDEAQAVELARRAAQGDGFPKLAHEFNVNRFNRALRGSMGWVGRNGGPPDEFAELESALFNLRPDEIKPSA